MRKSMGHDRIPNTILKMGCQGLAPSLTLIFNKCFEVCYWPTKWKKGEWVPIHKRESIYDVKNYRPVTLLPTTDKVFEKLLSTQVTACMEPRLSTKLLHLLRNIHEQHSSVLGNDAKVPLILKVWLASFLWTCLRLLTLCSLHCY